MAYPFKPKHSRYWRGRGRLSSGESFDVPLRVTTRELAAAKLRRYIDERERELLGLIAPKSIRDAASQPLTVHLDDYVSALRGKGVGRKHLALARNRTARLARECGWRHLRDVKGADLEAWRDRVQPRLSAKTVKEYQGLAFAFFGWLVRAGKIHENPLRLVSPVRTAGRERRQRRALSADELSQLRASLKARGLRGLYREAFYLWSYFSGARRNESKQLMVVDLTLTADAPFAKLRASTTKNGEEAVQPLPLDAAALLSEHLSRIRATRGKVFPYGVPTAKTFREDLIAAGIQPFDELGRQVDIHALRTSYATHLLMNDVPVRTVQELMRHSDIRLTTKIYTDAKALPLFEAVKAVKVPAPSVSHLVSLPAGKTGVKVANGGQGKALEVARKNAPPQSENAAETADESWRRGWDSNSSGELRKASQRVALE